MSLRIHTCAPSDLVERVVLALTPESMLSLELGGGSISSSSPGRAMSAYVTAFFLSMNFLTFFGIVDGLYSGVASAIRVKYGAAATAVSSAASRRRLLSALFIFRDSRG